MDYRHFLRVNFDAQLPNGQSRAQIRTITLPEAGHQLFLDNPAIFNKVLIMEMMEAKGDRIRYGRREADEGIRVWESI
jgi:hypothetical protein